MLIRGHVIEALRALPDASTHCVVTSPPYWGLRDYGLPPIAWGGDPDHRHEWGHEERGRRRDMLPREESASAGRVGSTGHQGLGPSGGRFCRCGAWLGQLGLEPSVELYVEHMVQVFQELRRALVPWGSCWINLGDTYHYSGRGPAGDRSTLEGGRKNQEQSRAARSVRRTSLLDHQLAGVPWRVALALQADGWVLRSETIWAKPAPTPESVAGWRWERHRVRGSKEKARDGGVTSWMTGEGAHGRNPAGRHAGAMQEMEDCPGCPRCAATDGCVLRRGSWRPTRAHEQVFQLANSLPYYGDAEAVREPATDKGRWNGRHGREEDERARPPGSRARTLKRLDWTGRGRNPRSVWTIPPEPYAGEHFATYPVALPARCIEASTPEAGVCSGCGAPWVPVVEHWFRHQPDVSPERGIRGAPGQKPLDKSNRRDGFPRGATGGRILAHRPTCPCSAPAHPAVILDPFAGTGSTGVAAVSLGRRFIGIDLSMPYLLQARNRIGEYIPAEIVRRGARLATPKGPLFE